MEARKIKAILEEANVQEMRGGFCAISASGLFHQAKEIIQDAYKNSAYLGGFIEEVGMQDVFDLGVVDISLIEKLSAYTILNKHWCGHAREFLNLSDEDLSSFLIRKESEGKVDKNIRARGSNVFSLKLKKRESFIDYQSVKKFLKVSGFKISDKDIVSEDDIEFLVMQTKEFIEDAYENSMIARSISMEVLNQSPEILATINPFLLDHLSEYAAKNDAWMVSTKKSFFSQEGSCTARKNSIDKEKCSNVAILPSMPNKYRKARVNKETDLEIHRL